MDFPAGLFPSELLIMAAVCYAIVCLYALRTAPLGKLLANEFTHRLFAACVALLVLWNIKAGVEPGIHFHLLGVTTLTLMVGWQFAWLGVSLVVLGTTLYGNGSLETYALNVLMMGGVPILFTSVLLDLAQRRLPHNFFIYIYINAFLASGLAITAAGFIAAFILWSVDIHSFEWLGYQYLVFFPLIFFSEAVMNGMITTMLVALRPNWINSFDDERYINGK